MYMNYCLHVPPCIVSCSHRLLNICSWYVSPLLVATFVIAIMHEILYCALYMYTVCTCIIGASLSEPQTSRLCMYVSIYHSVYGN